MSGEGEASVTIKRENYLDISGRFNMIRCKL